MFEIKEKFRPFSHRPGFCSLVPQTTLEAEVFPALVRIYDLKARGRELVEEIPLPLSHRVDKFTIFQDLEKGCLTVTGEDLSYHILPTGKLLFKKKAPSQLPLQGERLFLGIHKKMEWERIKERGDFQEIFPLWLQNGSLLPPISGKKGGFSLLEECRKRVGKNRPEHILEAFKNLFLVHFRDMLIPRFEDSEHQGIPYNVTQGDTPLHLLKESALLIRSLFIEEDGDLLKILPHLPPEFHSGIFTNIQCSQAILDIEWSKKTVRQMRIKSSRDGALHLQFSPELARFRLRRNLRDRGAILECAKAIEVMAGESYLLDCFKK